MYTLPETNIAHENQVAAGYVSFREGGLVPLIGGLGDIYNHPIDRKNATFLLPSGGLYATYHRKKRGTRKLQIEVS